MRLLIVGGNGFIGRSLQEELSRSPHEVVALGRRNGLDLTDLKGTCRVLTEIRPDAVYNCAAHVGSLHYVSQHAADLLHDNTVIAINLYRAVQQVCPKAIVINPLSNCSYPGDADFQKEEDWLKGDVHPSVFSAANAKRFVYMIAVAYKKQYDVRSINFLVPNTFGPGDYTDPNRTHALNGMVIRMIHAHRNGEPRFEIWGTGRPVREWGYVKDVAHVLARALGVREDLTYPVNIGQNRGYSIAESARLIAGAIGFGGKLWFNTKYQDGAPSKVLDDRRFRQLFPDFQFSDHEQGIRETVDYYQTALA